MHVILAGMMLEKYSNDCAGPLPPAAVRGLELFNLGEYFEAHEELETAWREEVKPLRLLYQGILQVAVTYLHIRLNNYEGAVIMAGRAMSKLILSPDTCRGVNVKKLRQDFQKVQQALANLNSQDIARFDWRLFTPIDYET